MTSDIILIKIMEKYSKIIEQIEFLQGSFKSQLKVTRALMKEKKLNKRIKSMQNAILLAIASFERLNDHAD